MVHECEDADVELTALEEQRPLDVFLHDDALAFLLLSNELNQLLPRADNFDASTSILILWLHDPQVLAQLSAR